MLQIFMRVFFFLWFFMSFLKFDFPKFLLENKYITTSQISSLNDTIDNYNLLVLNKMRIQINLLLKYRIKNDNRYLYKVISELDSIKENEIHILTKFIDLLEQSCREQENQNVNKEC